MNTFGLFILKACVCLFAFYLPYLIFFSRATFFMMNRIYLLAAILFSFILPFTSITRSEELIPTRILEFYEPTFTQTTPIQIFPDSVTDTITIFNVLPIIYFVGITFHIARLFLSIQSILKAKRQGKIFKIDDVRMVKTNSTEVFSFFNIVFLPKGEAAPLIVEHERAHILQFHWVDLVILEFATIVLWFNPLMILYKRSLKLQHEYLADRSVMQKGFTMEDYLACMANRLDPIKQLSLISSFYFQSIKKRIIMLTREKTSLKLSGLYLIVVPIIACLLFSFSSPPNYPILNHEPGDSTIQKELSFISPITANLATLSSEFGERMHPLLHVKRFHTGIDLIAEEGVTVMSTEIGMVTDSRFDSLQGNFIIIQHDQVYSTYYSHLKMRAVQIGDKVQKKSIIGQVGNTGLSLGPHLHYEVRKNGQPVNPKDYLEEVK